MNRTTDFTKPRCPDHGVNLVDCHKGRGICPVSGAVFSYSEDEAEKKEELRMTVYGPVKVKNWNVKHVEGDDI